MKDEKRERESEREEGKFDINIISYKITAKLCVYP